MIKVFKIFVLLFLCVALKSQSYQVPIINDTSDYANKVFIDPDWTGTESGTVLEPYNSFSDFSLQANTAYLIKAGTTLDEEVAVTDIGIYIGKYGSGAKPIISDRLIISNSTGIGITVDSVDIMFDHFEWAMVVISESSIPQNVTLANMQITGGYDATHQNSDGTFGSYPHRNIHGKAHGITIYHCELSYSEDDGFFSYESTFPFFVSNYFHHNNMGGIDANNSAGDGIQFETADISDGYVANNVIDRQHTIWKFALIVNATLATQENVVVEWNTFVGPRQGNGGSTVRWLAGTNNKFNYNEVYTPWGLPGLSTASDLHINQTSPYGVRSNYEIGPGYFYAGTLDASNIDFEDEAEYQAYLTANVLEEWGSDLDTANFWGEGSPSTNPCATNPISIQTDSISPDTNNLNTGAIYTTVSGGYENLVYTWAPDSSDTTFATGLPAGNYSLTVTDDSSCYASRNFVVGSADTTATDSTLNIIAVSSNLEDGLNIDDNMLDGDFNTRWSNNLDTAIAVFELDSTRNIKYCLIASYQGNIRKTSIHLYTSLDSVNWTSVFNDSTSGTTLSYDTLDIIDSYGRYIKLEGYGNDLPVSEEWTSITEIRFLGDSGSFACNLSVSSLSVTNESDGDGSGAIDLTVSGGFGALSYLWSNTATTQDISSLSTGEYSVVVTDDSSCTATGSASVYNEIPLGGVNDTISTDSILINLTTSSYTEAGWLTIDSPNDNQTFVLSPIDTFTVVNSSATATNGYVDGVDLVPDNVAQACHNINSGDLHFRYSYDPDSVDLVDVYIFASRAGAFAFLTYASLDGSDTLSVDIQDNDDTFIEFLNFPAPDSGAINIYIGSEFVRANAIIIVPKQITGAGTITYPLDITSSVINNTCYGDSDGSISILSTFNGASPYSYLWNIDSTSTSVSGLQNGSYSVLITDANDSTVTKNFTVTSPDSIYYEYNIDQPTNGQDNGQIRIFNISGGSGSYTIEWSTGSTALTVPNLPPGTYWFQITDGNGCATDTIYIVLFDDTCDTITLGSYQIFPDVNSQSNGRILPDLNTVDGYFNSFYFYWSDSSSGDYIDNLSAGSYWLIITGDDGCSSDTIDFVVPAVTVSSLDTIQWDVDITPTSWVNKINAGINVLNLSIEPDVDTLVVPSTWQTWYGSTNDYIQEFPSIVNDTLIYGTDNLGNFVEKANAAIKLTLE